MYQEMLNLVRDYSDVCTNMTDNDPLSSNYEAELDKYAREDIGGSDSDDDDVDQDRDDSDTELEIDQLVKEEMQE